MYPPPADPHPSQPEPGSPYGSYPPAGGHPPQAGWPPPPPPAGWAQPAEPAAGWAQPAEPQAYGTPPGYGHPQPYAGHPQPGGHPTPGGFPPPGDPGYAGYPPADPGYAGYPPGQPYAPPPKTSRTGLLVGLLSALALLLCLGGGGGLAWYALSDNDPAEPTPTASAGPTPAASDSALPGPSAPTDPDASADPGTSTDPTPAGRTRLVAPATLAGRPKLTDPEFTAVADQMVRDMKSSVRNETSAIGGFYGDPDKQDMLMIAGASGLILNPNQELVDALSALSRNLTVRNIRTVDAGPLGGEARCGDGRTDNVPLGVCVWADRGSVVMFVVYFASGREAATELVTIRGQVQQRG